MALGTGTALQQTTNSPIAGTETTYQGKAATLHETISARAHALWRERGERVGFDVEDWLGAERIILHEQELAVQAEVRQL